MFKGGKWTAWIILAGVMGLSLAGEVFQQPARQNSSGGKNNLGSITKRGSTYLRTLLIQGAKAIALTRQYDNPIFLWVQKLRERAGWQKAVVALANKNARILWAVMTREKRYDAHHISSPFAALIMTPT